MKKEKIDYGLKFFVEVLGAENLHWGFFPGKRFPDGGGSLESLKEAQREYTNHLISYIPKSVKRILDVGCGIGTTGNILSKNGYDVTCISNDAYQGEMLKKRHPDLRFVRSRFEKFPEDRPYDLLLFSESSQYIDIDIFARKAYGLLKPSGFVLVCDYFRKENNCYYKTCNIIGEFERKMKEGSFALIRQEDITDYVTPTIDLASHYYSRYGLPCIEILGGYLETQINRPIRFLANVLFKKKLKKLNCYVRKHTPEKFDSKLFKEKIVYLTQLWQKR